MKIHRSFLLCCLFLGAAMPLMRGASDALSVFSVDWPKSPDYEEQFLVETLQGLANRKEARLYVRMYYPGDPTSDEFWKHYLETEKGYKFTQFHSLNEAVQHFAKDGTIKGLVVYPSHNESMACIAVNAAMKRNLLPVSDRVLACKSQWLSAQNYWVEDTFKEKQWSESLVEPLRVGPEGLTIECQEESFKVKQLGSAAERWVQVGPDTRSVEVEISKAGAKWTLEGSDMSGKIQTLIEPSNDTGVHLGALPASWLGPVQLRLCVYGKKGDTVTVRKVRLLNEQGEVAKALPVPPQDVFAGLPIVEDLRNRFVSNDEAWLWALDTLLPSASRKMAFSYDNIWQYSGMDLAVAREAFIFRDDFEKNRTEPLRVFDRVSEHLERPGVFCGWAEPEWVYCARVSHAGHYVLCSIAPNYSFFQHVPVKEPVVLPQPPSNGKALKKKFYVLFHVIDGDGFTNITARYHAQTYLGWDSPRRGKTPICWTIQPLLQEYAPALLEYYAKTATPNDGFMSGASGAGYAYLSMMPSISKFGSDTQKSLAQANLQSADIWDLYTFDPEYVHRYLSGPDHRMRCYLPAPPSYNAWAPLNRWLEDGTPVLTASTRPGMNLWGNYPELLDFSDPASDLVKRIIKTSETVEAPFFIVVHGKMFPDLVEKVAQKLPSDQFEVITMTDVERLATDAGRFTAQAEVSGASPGQPVSVELAVRNPDGKSGAPGKIHWELPAGWKATPASWAHSEIAAGTTLRESIRIQIPKDAKPGLQRIVFSQEGDPCSRTVRIEVYSGSEVVFPSAQKHPWKNIGSGAVKIRDGRTILRGNGPGDAVSLSAAVDFDRSPLLEVSVPWTRSKWGVSLQDGKLEKKLMWGEALIGTQLYDLSEATKWEGRKQIQIRVNPAITGQEMELGTMRIHYRK